MKRFLFFLLLLFTIAVSWNTLYARSWDDLDSGEHEIFGSEREEKFPVKTLFMEMESWNNHFSFMFLWFFKYTDYPKYTSTRILPFYYGLDSKIDNRSLTVLPPLLTWLERDGKEYTKFIFFPLYYSDYGSYEYNRSLAWPLIWWGGSDPKNGKWQSTYHAIIPFLWFHWQDNNPATTSGESVWINPLLFSYSHWNAGKTDEYIRWFPVIPVITYNSVDNYGGHRNFFLLLDYSWRTVKEEDTLERFWLLPLLLWGEGSNGYTYILPPVYIHNRYDNGDYYFHLLPLFSVWNDSYGDTSRQLLTPLFAKRTVTDTKSGEEIYSNFFFPLIPMFFRSSDRNEGTHTNVAWLLDWESDKDGHMKNFWLVPFIFHEFREWGYRIYFPLYIRDECSRDYGTSWGIFHYHDWSASGESVWSWPYYESDSSDGSWYRHFIPLFAAWVNKYEGIMEEKQVITPLWCSRKVTDVKSGENIYSNFFFPLVPIFFTSSDRDEGTHTNIAWILDWEKNSQGNMKSFWLAPLVFHEFRDYGYRIYLPFYVRPSGADEQNGVSFSLFHYHGWSPGDDTLWALLYYHNVTYRIRDPKFGPVPEYEETREYYRHFLPVYWSWKNPETSGSLFLPLVLNYSDKYTRLHINLTGIAYKTFTGPFNPDIGIGLSAKEGSWFLDTDISWFYDIIAFSWRVPVIKNDSNTTGDDKKLNDNEKAIEIKKKSVAREDSQNFFGWEILFGWMAYRHADTRYHFRLLPLSWFTWDASSDEKFYMFLPFFLSYYSEETKTGYFLVAPFYASQEEGDSYSKGYLVNLYWDEYDAPSNYREKSILWPFINWHYSPDKHGFRIFPLFWYGNWKDNESTISRSISPIHYSMSIMDGAGNYTYRKRLNPFFYLKESSEGNSSSYTFFAPVIPLYYYTWSQERGDNGLVVNDYTSISPFHIYTEFSSANNTESYNSSTLVVPLVPLFYRSTEKNLSHWNFLGLIDRCTDTDYSRFFIFPLFYTSRKGDVKYRNILGLIDWETGGSSGGSSMFLPFYLWHGGDETSLTIPILLTRISSGKDWSSKFIAGTYWYDSPGYSHQDILLIYDHVMTEYNGTRSDEYSFVLDTISVDISPEVMEMQAAWGVLCEFTRHRGSGEYDFDALLWFAGFDNERGGFHSRLLPVWYYQSYSKDDWFLVVPPLLSFFGKDGSGNFDLALLGTLYYRNENIYSGEDRRMILLGTIYNEVKKPERKYHARGSLWGLLWDYETEEDSAFTKFTILKGLYKYVEKDGKGENTFFWFL